MVEAVDRRDGEVRVKVRGRAPAVFPSDALTGPAFGIGDVIAISENGGPNTWAVEIIDRPAPY